MNQAMKTYLVLN